MEMYMKKCYGDWFVVFFGNEMIKELKNCYYVMVILKLIIVMDDGDVVIVMGRKEVVE